MNAAEAAVYTDCSERHFRELTAKGVFPHIRVGRRVLFRRDAINAALGKLERQTLNADPSANGQGSHEPLAESKNRR